MAEKPYDRLDGVIWYDGKLVPWGEAKVHVLAHGLQYGTGVFEGMKSYPTADGPAIFRMDAHLERFYQSAELYDLAIPYSKETIAEASLEVVRAKDDGTLQYDTYFNADESEAIVHERFRDSDALMQHGANLAHLMEAILATGTCHGELLGNPSAEIRANLGSDGPVQLFTPYQLM